MRVLLAFDKFKDSLSAPEACRIAAEALRVAQPDWAIDTAPLTDGGEGFGAILTTAAGGELIEARVVGPLGKAHIATFGMVRWGRLPAAAKERLTLTHLTPDDTVAIIEMASASGLALVAPGERNPWRTTSYGTGQLLALAATRGARALLLGVGGSATHDLGLGALAALGLRFFDDHCGPLFPPTTAAWEHITKLAGRVPASFPPLRIACDVTNPLLGPNGAAATYALQKGLPPADLPQLESASLRMAAMLSAHCGQPTALAALPGAGAAGGIAFGLMAGARGQIVAGAALVHDWLDLERRIASADLVVTGEGRFDASSLNGKGPGALIRAAAEGGKPVVVLAGALAEVDSAALPSAVEAHAITPTEVRLPEACARAPEFLAAAVQRHLAVSRRR